MSFSQTVKEDLLKKNNDSEVADKLQIEAMLRFSSEIIIGNPLKLAFSASLMSVIRNFILLIKKYYDVEYEIESRKISRLDHHTFFTLTVYKGAKDIIDDLNLIKYSSSYRDMELDDDLKIAYLRGAFLVKGTVNDPNSKSSHLEISSINENEVLFVQKLMNEFEMDARIAKRKNYLITYIKAKNIIGDFLYLLGATSSMEYYEDVIITKEIKTTAKRTINLDVANQDKTNNAAKEQLAIIRYLEYNYPLEKLDSKLLMVMKVRKENPEHSLMQLLDIIHEDYDPKLTKSGLNHRFRKLKEIAKEHSERKEKR